MNIIHNKNYQLLPTLSGLRGFEAAARRMSFTEAAQELNVSQTAISHQVRKLEEQLELKLFNRAGKSISLTSAGEKLLSASGQCFETLYRVVSEIKTESLANVLTISVTPSFASKWLVQRLDHLWHKYPGIQLRIHHSLELANFTTDGVDVAIRAGDGDWTGAVTKLNLLLDLSPICHPSILEGERPLKNPEDLKHHKLLHEDNHDDWTIWLDTVGAVDVDPKSGNVMNDSNSLGIAVENCQGVALGRMALIEGDLKSGRIARPFSTSIPSPFAYYLVCPEKKYDDPNVKRFREFILNEIH